MPWRFRSWPTDLYKPAGAFRSHASTPRARSRAPEPPRSVPDRRSALHVTLLLLLPLRKSVEEATRVPPPNRERGPALQFLRSDRNLNGVCPGRVTQWLLKRFRFGFQLESGDDALHPRKIRMSRLQTELEGPTLRARTVQLLRRGQGVGCTGLRRPSRHGWRQRRNLCERVGLRQ